MNPRWSPPEGATIDRAKLIRDARLLYGPDTAGELDLSLKSVIVRRDYAQYHFAEAKRLALDQVSQVNCSEDPKAAMSLIFPGIDDDSYRTFHDRRFRAEAHLVALLQSLHSIGDTLGHVIYFARGMAGDARTHIKERLIGLAAVRQRLDEGDPLAKLLEDYAAEPVAQQLEDMVNHSKHRAVVFAPVSLDFTGTQDEPLGLTFAQFTRLGSYNPSRRVMPFIEEAFTTQAAYAMHTCLILADELATRADGPAA